MQNDGNWAFSIGTTLKLSSYTQSQNKNLD